MPGIDPRAPERTETSSGFSPSPNFFPVMRPTAVPTFVVVITDAVLRLARFGSQANVDLQSHQFRDNLGEPLVSGHRDNAAGCPLYPRKRTLLSATGMSAYGPQADEIHGDPGKNAG